MTAAPQSIMPLLTQMTFIVPELMLAVAIVVVIACDMFLPREKSWQCGWVALAGLGIAAMDAVYLWNVTSGRMLGGPARLFWGMVSADNFAMFFKLMFLAGAGVTILLSLRSAELTRMRSGEYYALLLTATMASCFMASSSNMLMLYLALETLSLPSYVLAGYRKSDRQAAEASLKYILFGAVSSGVMLYGLSLLYGLAGSLDYAAITRIATVNYPVFIVTMIFLIAGFGFKMSAAPFHFWAPDVYEGAPTPITAYLSVVSKMAGFAAIMRLLAPYFSMTTIAPYFDAARGMLGRQFDLTSIFWLLAVLTMTLGNFTALRQTNIKRLLAYSSIAHAGYMLTAFVAHNKDAFSAVMFYLIIYFIMNFGMFAAVTFIYNRTGSFQISDWRGLFYRSPIVVVCMGILLVSLIGLPPTAGFVGKWKLFVAVVEEGQRSASPWFFYSLVLIALANSVVSLYYYVGIIKQMCFYEPGEKLANFRFNTTQKLAMLCFAAPIIALQINWQPLSRFVERGMGAARQAVIMIIPMTTHQNQTLRAAEKTHGPQAFDIRHTGDHPC